MRALLCILAAVIAGCQGGPRGSPRAGDGREALVEGEGPPLVMLGGGVAGAAGFAPHAAALADRYRVIRVESLRHSRRGRPLPAGYSIELESRGVARTLDRLGVTDPVFIVGHSFGALVALDFALDHPERVRAVVLAEPPAFWAVPPEVLRNEPGMRAMVELTRTLGPDIEPTDDHLSRFQRLLGKPDADPPAVDDPARRDWEARRAALRGLSAVADHTDDPARLRMLRRPVLIVTGTTTVPFHRRINDLLAAALPQAERAELDGGHAAPTAQVDAFVRAVRLFCDRHD